MIGGGIVVGDGGLGCDMKNRCYTYTCERKSSFRWNFRLSDVNFSLADQRFPDTYLYIDRSIHYFHFPFGNQLGHRCSYHKDKFPSDIVRKPSCRNYCER